MHADADTVNIEMGGLLKLFERFLTKNTPAVVPPAICLGHASCFAKNIHLQRAPMVLERKLQVLVMVASQSPFTLFVVYYSTLLLLSRCLDCHLLSYEPHWPAQQIQSSCSNSSCYPIFAPLQAPLPFRFLAFPYSYTPSRTLCKRGGWEGTWAKKHWQPITLSSKSVK